MTTRAAGAGPAVPVVDDRPLAAAPAPRPVEPPAPQPVLIEAAGRTCLGWWHAPAAVDAPPLPLAVVLASSWGAEELAAYDGQRALAAALARGGLGALRFDWPDTGDSSAPTGSTTIDDALAAFDAAAARALALSGHERLAFVGVRLGALLAAHAAAARLDVDALVALRPVAGGRAFVRAQSAVGLGRLAPRPGALIDPAELPVSLGGFPLPVRRLEALSALRWPAAATTSVLEALLVQPVDAPGHTAADALARMGMRVCEQAHAEPGGAAAIGEVVRWLRERAADATVLRGVSVIEDFGVADPANPHANAALADARLDAATAAVLALSRAEAPVWMRLREQGVAVRERVVRLADAGRPALVGVLGEPDRPADGPRHALVLVSSGRERRVGPQRLWVPWARRRASLGDVVLRLDASGSGDSAPADAAAGADDVARAVAWLRREHGVAGCTLVGIGAGATRAWRAALAGLAVDRVVAIDPVGLRAVQASSRASRALRACVRLLRGRDEAPAGPGASLHVVRWSATAATLVGRRERRRLRGAGAAFHDVASPPAGVVDPAALHASLDALLAAGPGQAPAARPDDVVRALARARDAACATEALRVIARSSRRAA